MTAFLDSSQNFVISNLTLVCEGLKTKIDKLFQMDEKIIIVTGFGPFAGHELINASWEAVRLLPDKIDFNGVTYKIDKQLVPVIYEKVDKIVEEIWEKNPELVIHCGVHGAAKSIHIEELAYNKKFNRPDYSGKSLQDATVCLGNNGTCEMISTRINVNEIVKSINDLTIVDNVCVCSKDVGNYLCGYIYLNSLDKNPERSLFVHVPPIDEPFTSSQTSEIILEIMKQCLAQISPKGKLCQCE